MTNLSKIDPESTELQTFSSRLGSEEPADGTEPWYDLISPDADTVDMYDRTSSMTYWRQVKVWTDDFAIRGQPPPFTIDIV